MDRPLTLQLAAPFLFPAGCDKAQLAGQAAGKPAPRRCAVGKGQRRRDWTPPGSARVTSSRNIVAQLCKGLGAGAKREMHLRRKLSNEAVASYFDTPTDQRRAP